MRNQIPSVYGKDYCTPLIVLTLRKYILKKIANMPDKKLSDLIL